MRRVLLLGPFLAFSCSPASGGDFEGGGSPANEAQDPVAWSPEQNPGAQQPAPESPDLGSPPSSEPSVEPEPEPPVPDEPSGVPADPPADACPYPAGPYGVTPGGTMAPSLSWEGYAPGAQNVSSFGSQDLFDCDGSRGIGAVLIVYAAGWCSACKQEASLLPSHMASWEPAGIVVVELLIETAAGAPADVNMATQWRDAFGLVSVYVGADPGFAFDSQLADALPFKVIIDPRDMRVVRAYTGDTYDHELLELAMSNQ